MDRGWEQGGPIRGDDASGFRSSPEILPPDGRTENDGPYYIPSDQPPRYPAQGLPDQYDQEPRAPKPRRRNTWAFAPATYILLGINCAVFLAMIFGGVPVMSPTTDQLLLWGANNGTLVLHDGQWWRLITAMFVHVGVIHLATNMWCLWNLGLLGEPLVGPFGLFAAYILTGFAGNLLSTAVHPGVSGGPMGIVGAGASGAVFGLAGVLILLLKSPLLPLPQIELKRLRRSVIYFAVLNFAIGLYTAFGPSPVQIDNMAHLGGFLSGLALGIPLVPKIGAPRKTFLQRRWLAVGGLAFVLLLLSFGLRSFWS